MNNTYLSSFLYCSNNLIDIFACDSEWRDVGITVILLETLPLHSKTVVRLGSSPVFVSSALSCSNINLSILQVRYNCLKRPSSKANTYTLLVGASLALNTWSATTSWYEPSSHFNKRLLLNKSREPSSYLQRITAVWSGGILGFMYSFALKASGLIPKNWGSLSKIPS